MILVELTSTPTQDLPLDAFKAHLRLGSGFTETSLQDEVLESYLRAAMAAVEARIGKMLYARRASWTVTKWTDPDAQPLPVAPISSIETVVLTDRAGADTSVEASAFALMKDTHRPVLSATGAVLPDIPQGGSATITFDAGFGADWLDIPPDLREAVMLLASHYYETRFDTTGAGGLMPFGVMALLDPHRNIRILGFGT